MAPEVLQGALDWAVRRHPALRSVFPAGWEHHLVHEDLRVDLVRRLVAGPSPDRRWHQAVEFAYRDRMRPFDLARGPLLRATLLSTGPHRHLLVLSFDQQVIDTRSAVTVVDELVDSADLLATGRPLPPAEPDGYLRLRREQDEWLRGPPGRRRSPGRVGRQHARPAVAARAGQR